MKRRVVPAADMTKRTFIKHVSTRHPLLQYWSRGEHDTMHLLFPFAFNHHHRRP
jgi:hypothetical protein